MVMLRDYCSSLRICFKRSERGRRGFLVRPPLVCFRFPRREEAQRQQASCDLAKRATGKYFVPGALVATLLLLVCLFGIPSLTQAEPFLQFRSDPRKPSTSRKDREDAIRNIPLSKLDAQSKAKIRGVLSTTNIFRRLPTCVTQCDPDLYLFLAKHPDVVVNIWEVLDLSKLQLRQTAPNTFEVSDGQGTHGTMEILFSSHSTHVIYSEGTYKGPLFHETIHGRGVMILKTGYTREPDGRYYITSRLDSFLDLEPGGIEFLTKTFLPLVGKVADTNFLQTIAFVGSLSRTAERKPDGIHWIAKRLHRIQPDVQKEFVELTAQVAQKEASNSQTISLGQSRSIGSIRVVKRKKEPIPYRRPLQ